MSHDDLMTPALLSLGVRIFISWGLTRWRNSKGRTSIFANDQSLEDVGLSFISSLFNSFSPNRVDGITELRPPWGLRDLAPVIALVLLLTTELSPLWESVGIHDPVIHKAALIALCLIFGYSWFILLFVQKVVYDGSFIECYGVDATKQERKLSDLVDIRVHDKRPALVLTFAQQKTSLYHKIPLPAGGLHHPYGSHRAAEP
ncbi:hypothetical protein SAMN05444358_11456 [Ruegeria halocynthiae]|uniref:Uncharacterized protein n=1 Tax=Ruegeria halocynthiae TaxID=985054 RepID=A0A1H3FGE6_9RHOB|nr:hypothetical protein [Ruegeria halocynthiae]SDX89189.1 hypothetical protein SAMN05444358_11456 [Ruegeria halocynthiae]